MLFVFYPIDVLFLDKNNIVVDKKDNFKPFTLYNSKKKGERIRAMEILKMRGTQHTTKTFKFEITNKGFVVHPNNKIDF